MLGRYVGLHAAARKRHGRQRTTTGEFYSHELTPLASCRCPRVVRDAYTPRVTESSRAGVYVICQDGVRRIWW